MKTEKFGFEHSDEDIEAKKLKKKQPKMIYGALKRENNSKK